MSAIKKRLRKWLLEPKSRGDASEYLALLILMGLVLTLFIRAMTAVFAEGILSGIYTIFMTAIGVVFMAAIIFMLFYTLSLLLRITINLIINTYNYLRKGR